jgi:hypothetical protein
VDDNTPPAAPVRPRRGQPRADRVALLREKYSRIAISLSLIEQYEFELEGSTLKLVSDEPYHEKISWTSRSIDAPEDVGRYAYGTGNGTITLASGVTVLLGRSGAGKTRFAFEHLTTRAALAGIGVCYIRFMEPGSDSYYNRLATLNVNVDNVVKRPTFELEFASQFASALLDPNISLIIVDSLRYLFYQSGGGATGRGGVNMSLFMTLTHLDAVAMQLGKRVVIVINPLTDDDSAFAGYVEAASGAVSSVITIANADEVRISSRNAQLRGFSTIKIGYDTLFSSNRRRGDDASSRVAMGGGDGNAPLLSASNGRN